MHIPYYKFKQVQPKTKNLSRCECHSVLQKLSCNKIYKDEVQNNISRPAYEQERYLSSIKLPISIIFSTDYNDYWCSIFKVIWDLLRQLHKKYIDYAA